MLRDRITRNECHVQSEIHILASLFVDDWVGHQNCDLMPSTVTVILVKSMLRANIFPIDSVASNCILALVRLPARGKSRVSSPKQLSLYYASVTSPPSCSKLWKLTANSDAFILGGNLNATHMTWGDSVSNDNGKALFR